MSRKAIEAQASLIKSAQEILTSYLVPDGIKAHEAIDKLLQLLDGTEWRAVDFLVKSALAKPDSMPVYVAYTNTDCTEGRGRDEPIAVCKTFATAKRKAFKSYVQGSDGPVKKHDALFVDGCWMVPLHGCVNLIEPTDDDAKSQRRIDNAEAALKKARESGLTDDDIKALRGAL